MSPTTFTILVGGSMLVTTLVWIYLIAITVQEYRRGWGTPAGGDSRE